MDNNCAYVEFYCDKLTVFVAFTSIPSMLNTGPGRHRKKTDFTKHFIVYIYVRKR